MSKLGDEFFANVEKKNKEREEIRNRLMIEKVITEQIVNFIIERRLNEWVRRD